MVEKKRIFSHQLFGALPALHRYVAGVPLALGQKNEPTTYHFDR